MDTQTFLMNKSIILVGFWRGKPHENVFNGFRDFNLLIPWACMAHKACIEIQSHASKTCV